MTRLNSKEKPTVLIVGFSFDYHLVTPYNLVTLVV